MPVKFSFSICSLLLFGRVGIDRSPALTFPLRENVGSAQGIPLPFLQTHPLPPAEFHSDDDAWAPRKEGGTKFSPRPNTPLPLPLAFAAAPFSLLLCQPPACRAKSKKGSKRIFFLPTLCSLPLPLLGKPTSLWSVNGLKRPLLPPYTRAFPSLFKFEGD